MQTNNKTLLTLQHSFLTLGAVAFTTIATITSCSSPTQKVEDAKTNVAEANQELDKANEEYLADVANYKRATEERIAANNASIAEFNKRVEKDKKAANADYKLKISELEKKNTDMQKRMDEYKETGKDNWEKFKTEFNHDMDELGQAFKDLTVKNTK